MKSKKFEENTEIVEDVLEDKGKGQNKVETCGWSFQALNEKSRGNWQKDGKKELDLIYQLKRSCYPLGH